MKNAIIKNAAILLLLMVNETPSVECSKKAGRGHHKHGKRGNRSDTSQDTSRENKESLDGSEDLPIVEEVKRTFLDPYSVEVTDMDTDVDANNCVYSKKYTAKWPHCTNIECRSGALSVLQLDCDKREDCSGVSFTTGTPEFGDGCLKQCGAYESFNGYGSKTHDYWTKNSCEESSSGSSQGFLRTSNSGTSTSGGVKNPPTLIVEDTMSDESLDGLDMDAFLSHPKEHGKDEEPTCEGVKDFIYKQMPIGARYPVMEYTKPVAAHGVNKKPCPDFLCDKNYPDNRMVLFYYPDVEAMAFRKFYREFGKTLLNLITESSDGKEHIEVFAISCCNNAELCEQNEVTEYPTFKLMRVGQDQDTAYHATFSGKQLTGHSALEAVEGVYDLLFPESP